MLQSNQVVKDAQWFHDDAVFALSAGSSAQLGFRFILNSTHCGWQAIRGSRTFPGCLRVVLAWTVNMTSDNIATLTGAAEKGDIITSLAFFSTDNIWKSRSVKWKEVMVRRKGKVEQRRREQHKKDFDPKQLELLVPGTFFQGTKRFL